MTDNPDDYTPVERLFGRKPGVYQDEGQKVYAPDERRPPSVLDEPDVRASLAEQYDVPKLVEALMASERAVKSLQDESDNYMQQARFWIEAHGEKCREANDLRSRLRHALGVLRRIADMDSPPHTGQGGPAPRERVEWLAQLATHELDRQAVIAHEEWQASLQRREEQASAIFKDPQREQASASNGPQSGSAPPAGNGTRPAGPT